MIKSMKLQNEIKIAITNFSRTDPEHKKLNDAIQLIFQGIDFDLSKDWNISFAVKHTVEDRLLTGTIKMTDPNVTGDQLSMFQDNNEDRINFKNNRT